MERIQTIVAKRRAQRILARREKPSDLNASFIPVRAGSGASGFSFRGFGTSAARSYLRQLLRRHPVPDVPHGKDAAYTDKLSFLNRMISILFFVL